MSKNYNPFSLYGKTLLVTGASSGIGRATAIECSRMGAKVILNGRNRERLDETLSQLEGVGHSIIMADITNIEQTIQMVKEICEIDGAVFCAGQVIGATFNFCKPDYFRKLFDVNFFGTVELFRQLVKRKKIKRGGSVVVLDSIGGVKSFSGGNSMYGSTKAALWSFTKSAAYELSPKRIRVNALLPGMVNTPMINNSDLFNQEDYKNDLRNYPLGRYGEPTEIAYAAVYLLSEASVWMTGSEIVIDGGFSIR